MQKRREQLFIKWVVRVDTHRQHFSGEFHAKEFTVRQRCSAGLITESGDDERALVPEVWWPSCTGWRLQLRVVTLRSSTRGRVFAF